MAASVTVLTMSGCGVPSSGPATVVSEVAREDTQESFSEQFPPLEPERDAERTVSNFLGASAGDWAGRDDRLDIFLETEADWSEPSAGMPVIRLREDGVRSVSGGSTTTATVEVAADIVGVYSQSGQVRKPTGDTSYVKEFKLSRDYQSDLWRIVNPPEQVVVLDTVFGQRYEPRPLYFPATSDAAGTLVPDLRWLPGAISDPAARHERMLEWLLAGPSEWLEASVSSAIPPGTAREGVTVTDTEVTVEVSARSATAQLDRFDVVGAQLAWTFGLDDDMVLTLVVDGREQLSDTVSSWAEHNRAPSDEETADGAAIYFIDEGVVRGVDPDAPFSGEAVEGLREAAVQPRGTQMAAVVNQGAGDFLMVGPPGNLERVGDFSAGYITDPQWINAATLLVLADGRPTAVKVSSGESAPVSMGDIDAQITDISLAPDARRLALVAGEHTYVAPVSYTDEFAVKLGEAQRVGVNIAQVADVGWSQETRLLMIGVVDGAEPWLWEVSIDNSEQLPMRDVVDSTTGQRGDALAVRCNPPDRNPAVGQPIVVQVGGSIGRVYGGGSYSPVRIERDGDSMDAVGVNPFVVG
ncbi:hypothetical protein GCM10023223_22070 [Stackebrandtia albiflava]